jgi:hypothetical protein
MDAAKNNHFRLIASAKTIYALHKPRFIGFVKIKAQIMFAFACDNLARMATIGYRLSAL